MNTLIVFLLLWVAGITLAYRRASLRTAALTAAGLMLVSLVAGAAIVLSFLLLLATLALGLLSVDNLRKDWLTRPLFRWYKQHLPPISDTEQEAIEAGTVWWEGQLFSGIPDWQQLHACGKPELSREEQAFLDGPVRQLCEMADQWQVNHLLADVPEEILIYLKQEKFFGLIIPKSYGGLELSAVAQTEVLTRIAVVGGVIANCVVVPNSLGPGELLLKYGTDEQKNHYLPRLASGEDIPCFALTGPAAGSDATAIPDRGIVCQGKWHGEEIIGMRLSFEKRYITLAPVATLIGLAFKLADPAHLLGEVEDYGITCALIPRDTPGLKIGRRHLPVGDPFLNGPVCGEDIFVPLAYIIGGPAMAGKGWQMLVNCLSAGRCISLPSLANGISAYALAATGAYSRLRKQFKVPLSHMEGIQKPLARMAGLAYIINAARLQTAVAVDGGAKPSVPSAILKYHCTEMARVIINDAFDIHAGKAVMKGPRNYLAAAYESIPVGITVEGANIMTRSLMIFGQGVVRCHPCILQEMQLAAAADAYQAERQFDEVLLNHLGFAAANAARSFIHALTAAVFCQVPAGSPLKRYYQQASRLSAALVVAADVSMFSLQGALKRREMLSARLGDLLSYLYLLSMVLKHYADSGSPGADRPLAEWACRYLLYQFQQAMLGLIENFPSRLIALQLKATVFPLGARFKLPTDRLDTQVANLFSADTETRRRFMAGLVLTAGEASPMGELEQLLRQADEMDAVDQKLQAAVKAGQLSNHSPGQSPGTISPDHLEAAVEIGLLGRDEAARRRDFDARLEQIIQVDDFPYADIGRQSVGRQAAC